ncbi:hypothetical protein ACLQ3C_20450 [Gordonia sp. DT30]|uniref:hypothetical protein n=1 Tax=unclassified Gordonia (in: high G+C Gram-positive bacteria) TaxID=2657482 RepID=UPI003CEB9881
MSGSDLPDDAFGPALRDKSLTLHLDPGVRSAVTAARTSLESFLQAGLDPNVPFLNDALGDSDEAKAVKDHLSGRRADLSNEMAAQAHSVDEIHTLMQYSLGTLTRQDSDG